MENVAFKDLLSFKDGVLQLSLKFSNYVFITEDALYFKTYLREPAVRRRHHAAVPGHRLPVRLLHGARQATAQPALLMLVMLPFWTSFLLRVYAWKGLLSEGGWVADVIVGLRPGPAAVRSRADRSARAS